MNKMFFLACLVFAAFQNICKAESPSYFLHSITAGYLDHYHEDSYERLGYIRVPVYSYKIIGIDPYLVFGKEAKESGVAWSTMQYNSAQKWFFNGTIFHSFSADRAGFTAAVTYKIK